MPDTGRASLLDAGLLTDEGDLFSLTEEKLKKQTASSQLSPALSRLTAPSTLTLRAAKNRPLDKFLVALSMPASCRAVAPDVAAAFGDIDALADAAQNSSCLQR